MFLRFLLHKASVSWTMNKVFCVHRSPKWIGLFVYFLGFCISYLLSHEQQTFIISCFVSVRNLSMASLQPLLHCDPKTAIKVSVRAGLSSSEDLCGEESASRLTYMDSGRIQFLKAWESQWFAGSWLETSLSSLPHGSLQSMERSLIARQKSLSFVIWSWK